MTYGCKSSWAFVVVSCGSGNYSSWKKYAWGVSNETEIALWVLYGYDSWYPYALIVIQCAACPMNKWYGVFQEKSLKRTSVTTFLWSKKRFWCGPWSRSDDYVSKRVTWRIWWFERWDTCRKWKIYTPQRLCLLQCPLHLKR